MGFVKICNITCTSSMFNNQPIKTGTNMVFTCIVRYANIYQLEHDEDSQFGNDDRLR